MFRDLVGSTGCAADGTTAVRNPVSRLVDKMFEGSTPSQGPQKGEGHAMQQQQGMGAGMSHPPAPPDMMGPPPHMAAAMQSGMARGMGMVHQQPHPPPAAAGMVAMPQRSMGQGQDQWANEFGSGAGAGGMMQMGPMPGSMNEAWAMAEADARARGAAGRGGRGWANEFNGGRGGPGGGMMRMPAHLAHPPMHMGGMEAAWGASAMAMQQQQQHQHFQRMQQQRGASEAAMAREANDAKAAGGGIEEEEGMEREQGRRSSLQDRAAAAEADESSLRQSAEAVVETLAADPDPKYRDSEVFSFMSSLAHGEQLESWERGWEASATASAPAAALEEAWASGEGGQQNAASALDQQGGGGGGMKGMEAAWLSAKGGENAMREGVQADGPTAGAEATPAFDEAWKEVNEKFEAAWQEGGGKMPAEYAELDQIWDEGDEDLRGMNAAWAKTAERLEAMGGGEGLDAVYDFRAENSFLDHPAPFEEGMRLFDEGRINEAVQCFEAELQRVPDNSEAWRMLGQSHAENDLDKRAIACLERAVEHDPYNIDALLPLGVSYVNELDSQRALKNLKAWVEHNPKYAGMEIQLDEYSDGTLMDEVMQLMIQAERWDQTDVDAKVVLGVLYNVSRDYDSAVGAFNAAAELRPGDYSLWNKVGATLANDNRSQEALNAYDRALEMKPRYARAWLNQGISLANLNRYREAASCYLKALQLSPEAAHIWAYLRIVFTCMERFDLVQRAAGENPMDFAGDPDLDFDGIDA